LDYVVCRDDLSIAEASLCKTFVAVNCLFYGISIHCDYLDSWYGGDGIQHRCLVTLFPNNLIIIIIIIVFSVPIVAETMGTIRMDFLSELGRCITQNAGAHRERTFLFQ